MPFLLNTNCSFNQDRAEGPDNEQSASFLSTLTLPESCLSQAVPIGQVLSPSGHGFLTCKWEKGSILAYFSELIYQIWKWCVLSGFPGVQAPSTILPLPHRPILISRTRNKLAQPASVENDQNRTQTQLSLYLHPSYRICLQCGRTRFDPWVGKIPWRREWQPTPVLLPGESHGQRSLAGYSLWRRRDWHDWATTTFTFSCFVPECPQLCLSFWVPTSA